MRILLIDNYDSFTYNLFDYFLQTGAECTVLRNDAFALDGLRQLDFQGIALSPGPKRPEDAGLLMPLIDRYYREKPMLGICLGHQALGLYFGAKLVKAAAPMHGKTDRISHNGHQMFAQTPPEFEVMRYHSLLLESLEGTPLDPTAFSSSGEIMALSHRNLPLTGLQFHPESILTEHGLQLLRNWVESVENL